MPGTTGSTMKYVMAAFYIFAGVMHFVNPGFYLAMMPRYLPFHHELIILSGIVEILCGLMLIFAKTQSYGAWFTIALLIAVFPANIQMAQDNWDNGGLIKYLTIVRLPLQFLLIYWAYQYTNETNSSKTSKKSS